jgi:hypothetical protein
MNYLITSKGNEGVFIDDKIGFFNDLCFQWKVDVTYIKSNLNGGLPAGCNSTEARLNR